MNKSQKTTPAHVMKRNANRAEAMLKQLANARRLMILCHLVDGEKTVSEVQEISGLSQSATLQHLAKMRAAGLISSEKRGQAVYYRIASMEAQAILSTLYLIYCK